jgi:hypothetical protein
MALSVVYLTAHDPLPEVSLEGNSALISEARDGEALLPYPPEYFCGPVCAGCRAKLTRETRDGYKW